MTVQETIIGKLAQAKAIKEAMSYNMPSEIFKQMHDYVQELLKEAIEINSHNSLEDEYFDNIEAIDEVVETKIIEKY